MTGADDNPTGLDALFTDDDPDEQSVDEIPDLSDCTKAEKMKRVGDLLGFDPQNLKTPAFTSEEVEEVAYALYESGYTES